MEINRTNFPLKKFIPASTSCYYASLNDTVDKGVEISEFYEETCIKVSSTNTTEKPHGSVKHGGKSSKLVSKTPFVVKLNVNQFMKSAENNDLEGLRSQLDHGMDVNTRDNYGWTALMCAACAGATKAVKYLLKQGADRDISAHKMNALKCAYKNKHLDVVEILSGNGASNIKQDVVRIVAADVDENAAGQFCGDCGSSVTSKGEKSHRSSTVHQFSLTKDGSVSSWTNFKIPSSNVGFKIMVKDGWNREHGLGPEGSGTKYPPKTILKRDREGLGSKFSKSIPKITHFEAGDTRAIQYKSANFKAKKLDKRQKERTAIADRLKTIAIRRQLSSYE